MHFHPHGWAAGPWELRRKSCPNSLDNRVRRKLVYGGDGQLIAEARQQTPEHGLKMTAFLRHSSVGCLVQHAAHIFIAFRGATAVVLLRTFLLAGTGSHPRRQL